MPVIRSDVRPFLMTAGMPVVSKPYCAPPPVMPMIWPTTSGSAAVEHVGGAEFEGQFASVRLQVDGDDRGGTCDPTCHHRRETHGPGAEHDEAGPGLHVHRTEDGAGAGLDAAAEWAEQLEREALVDHDDVARSGEAVRGERRLAEPARRHLVAVGITHGRGTVEVAPAQVSRKKCVAVRREIGHAVRALAARVEREHHVVAHLHADHVGTDGLDDT